MPSWKPGDWQLNRWLKDCRLRVEKLPVPIWLEEAPGSCRFRVPRELQGRLPTSTAVLRAPAQVTGAGATAHLATAAAERLREKGPALKCWQKSSESLIL